MDGSKRSVLSICSDLPETSFAAGETLIHEGERLGQLFILIDGEVGVSKTSIEVAIVNEPGSMFGEMSTLLDRPYSATVTARSPVRVYRIDDADQFLAGNSAVMYHVARLLAKRLHDVTSYLVDIKKQFRDREDHFGIVNDVLESLMHHQSAEVKDVPESGSDPRL